MWPRPALDLLNCICKVEKVHLWLGKEKIKVRLEKIQKSKDSFCKVGEMYNGSKSVTYPAVTDSA